MNKQIIEEAAEWFVEFNVGEVGVQAKQAFDTWLRQSPEHVRAYLELIPLWEKAALPVRPDLSADELIAAAMHTENVVAWNAAVRPTHSRRAPASPLPRRIAVAASAALLMICAGTAVWYSGLRSPTYTTAVGEQRFIRLSDGSTVELNTNSRIRLRYRDDERSVELMAGQAFFSVAHDTARPFIVASNGARVRAVGTQFDVYRKSEGTVVTVVEGTVAVADTETGVKELAGTNQPSRDPSAPEDARRLARSEPHTTAGSTFSSNAVLLSAGEQAVLSAAAPPKLVIADVDMATAWTRRRMVFIDTPLPAVASEFNRYNARPIIVEGRGPRDFRVSGSFSSADPEVIINFLREQPELLLVITDTQIRVTER